MSSNAPPLPPRSQIERQSSLDVPDDPPPAYEAQANSQSHEQTLDYGPSRPFQPAPSHVPDAMPLHAHSTGSNSYGSSSAPYSSPPSNLPPPNFPFWNGHNLSAQQTGFMAGPLQPPASTYGAPMQAPHQSPVPTGASSGGYATPHSPPPPPQRYSHTGSPSYAPPPSSPPPLPSRPPAGGTGSNGGPSAPKKYEPTTRPTAGQPLLRNGQILVYPVGKEPCWKCGNTGFKPFVGTGGDDPNHPCRKCWEKYGRPYAGAIQIVATSTPTPPNYQRPLRPQPPLRPRVQYGVPPGAYPGNMYGGRGLGPGPGPAMGYGGGPAHIHLTNRLPPPGTNAVVLRPGDPRMGGVLCQRCGGDGLVWGFLFEETCDLCHGVGRLF